MCITAQVSACPQATQSVIAAYLRAIGLVWEGHTVPCYPVGISHRACLQVEQIRRLGPDPLTACCVGAAVNRQVQVLGMLLQMTLLDQPGQVRKAWAI